MKILVNKAKSKWKKKTNCIECSSKLEIVADDLAFVADSRDGNAYTFKCPVCKKENWIDARLVEIVVR